MLIPKVLIPASGSRLVNGGTENILFAQPPEVLKGLLREKITRFDTLVLTDIKEKNGSLLNNLEFPFYFFLFVAKGLAEKRKINLVGDSESISQALRLLRFTLFGPTKSELEQWHTPVELRDEWLNVSEHLALKDDSGQLIPIENFFNLIPFQNDLAIVGGFTIKHTGIDQYSVSSESGDVVVDLNEDHLIIPPYPVPMDYVPGGQTKLGIEVLGGASGFSVTEPCAGLALCYNGDYILIDAIPFLDQHLYARGISKNQISAVFLTHLHDDHCSMFPLIEMPQQVEVITTREIYNMAIEKLSCNLGWSFEVVSECFKLVEVIPGDTLNYYGLSIKVHATVHSIPTIGATFSILHQGQCRDVCVVGDNQNMVAVREMAKMGIVRNVTLNNLERLYTDNFHLLIADGGAGAIHGDPIDSLNSKAERIVFVHVDELPEALTTTFSLASSGKRYTVLDGDSSIPTSQIDHYLTLWLGQPLPNRWMRNLLAEQSIKRYNTQDVIIVQDRATQGFVYLILTGYCEAVRHENGKRESIATLQAGDIIGEMAILTGSGVRNASVVALTPVTVCVFCEEIFRNFITQSGLQDQLESRWLLRPVIKSLPQYRQLSSTVIEKISRVAEPLLVPKGESIQLGNSHLYIFVEGKGTALTAHSSEQVANNGDEFGWRPFVENNPVTLMASSDCSLVKLEVETYLSLLNQVPQLNYQTRKRLVKEKKHTISWLLGNVSIY